MFEPEPLYRDLFPQLINLARRDGPAFHFQFPDPWWKRRHHRRRLVDDRMSLLLRALLAPGGLLDFRTDVEEYAAGALERLEAVGLRNQAGPGRFAEARPGEIPSVVWHLAQHLFPFNYAVPGQTRNSLVRFGDVLKAHPAGAALAAQLQLPADAERRDPSEPRNEFSGRDYRSLNFVVDLPVRVDDLLSPLDPMADELGRIVFTLVEFQVVDRATAFANERGESSHERYKKRQLKRVLRRLSRGLVVPKKRTRTKKGAP